MFCKFCGNKLDDNAKFCFKCGGDLSAPADSVPQSQEAINSQLSEPASEEGINHRKSQIRPIKICMLITMLVGIVLVVCAIASLPLVEMSKMADIPEGSERYVVMSELILAVVAKIGLTIAITALALGLLINSNRALDRVGDSYNDFNKKATAILVLVCCVGMAAIYVVMYSVNSMFSAIAYLGIIAEDPSSELVVAQIAGIIGFILSLGLVAPAVIAFIKGLMLRIKLRKIL